MLPLERGDDPVLYGGFVVAGTAWKLNCLGVLLPIDDNQQRSAGAGGELLGLSKVESAAVRSRQANSLFVDAEVCLDGRRVAILALNSHDSRPRATGTFRPVGPLS